MDARFAREMAAALLLPRFPTKTTKAQAAAWDALADRLEPVPLPDPDPDPPVDPGPVGERPTSRVQVGPRTSALAAHAGGELPPGTYSSRRFLAGISLSAAGLYRFTDCVGWLNTVGHVEGRTVEIRWCSMGGYAEGDGFSNFTVEDSLLSGNVEAWRPTGRTSHADITTPTPFRARRCIFVTQGKPPAWAHCAALHLLGGRDGVYDDCWFICEPRTNPDGTTQNSTPCEVELAADQRFNRCRFTKGGAHFAAYARGPGNRFTDCVVDEADGTLRAMTVADILPNAVYTAEEKAYVDGRRVP